MADDRGVIDHVLDLLADVPGVSATRFFGGWGVLHHGAHVGMVNREVVYARVAEPDRDAWEARGDSVPFEYERRGRTVVVRGYWTVPADGLEDPTALAGYLGLDAVQ